MDNPEATARAVVRSVRGFRSKSLASVDRVVPQRPHLFGIGPHRRLEALPIGRIQIGESEDLERGIPVALAQQRLHLEERVALVKLNRRIHPGQPHIGEERTKPRVGFEDAFKMLVPLRSGNVGRPARQQRPVGCRSRR